MKEKLELFIGPCVLESQELAYEIAGSVQEQLKPFADKVNLTFKGSYDKANRSSIKSFRGQGLEAGLKILENVKKEFGLPLITDFHTPDQADAVASVVDTLQVPAFLCRQTDMILKGAEACLKYDARIKVKKGQFLAPEDTRHIVAKANEVLPLDRILLTERGTSFGYNNLIVDMASFQTMKGYGVKTIYDATHSVQKPGGAGDVTGGKREQILVLAKAAVAAGCDGIFLECHPTPDKALSDSTNCLDLQNIGVIVEQLLKIYEVV